MDDLNLDASTLKLLLEIGAGLFTAIMGTKLGEKGFGYFLAWKRNRKKLAFRLLEAGIVFVFQHLRRTLEDDHKKVDAKHAKTLRKEAVDHAIELSERTTGKDIVTPAIGEANLDSAVEQILATIKKRGNVPK